VSITKIRSRKVDSSINYARDEDLLEQLEVFEKQMNWSIFEVLEMLKSQKADSLSITKEKPFHYFYARLSKKMITIRLQTSEKETEFKLPIEKLAK
jgi:hypothetical protein